MNDIPFKFSPTSFLKKIIIPLFTISLISLALVPIFGIEVKGAKRWLSFYLFRIQPIEFVKPLFVLMASLILSKKKIKSQKQPKEQLS